MGVDSYENPFFKPMNKGYVQQKSYKVNILPKQVLYKDYNLKPQGSLDLKQQQHKLGIGKGDIDVIKNIFNIVVPGKEHKGKKVKDVFHSKLKSAHDKIKHNIDIGKLFGIKNKKIVYAINSFIALLFFIFTLYKTNPVLATFLLVSIKDIIIASKSVTLNAISGVLNYISPTLASKFVGYLSITKFFTFISGLVAAVIALFMSGDPQTKINGNIVTNLSYNTLSRNNDIFDMNVDPSYRTTNPIKDNVKLTDIEIDLLKRFAKNNRIEPELIYDEISYKLDMDILGINTIDTKNAKQIKFGYNDIYSTLFVSINNKPSIYINNILYNKRYLRDIIGILNSLYKTLSKKKDKIYSIRDQTTLYNKIQSLAKEFSSKTTKTPQYYKHRRELNSLRSQYASNKVKYTERDLQHLPNETVVVDADIKKINKLKKQIDDGSINIGNINYYKPNIDITIANIKGSIANYVMENINASMDHQLPIKTEGQPKVADIRANTNTIINTIDIMDQGSIAYLNKNAKLSPPKVTEEDKLNILSSMVAEVIDEIPSVPVSAFKQLKRSTQAKQQETFKQQKKMYEEAILEEPKKSSGSPKNPF